MPVPLFDLYGYGFCQSGTQRSKLPAGARLGQRFCGHGTRRGCGELSGDVLGHDEGF
jgi:hypothetical protein